MEYNLTTGQMIDSLKIGQTAVAKDPNFRVKNIKNSLKYVDEEGKVQDHMGHKGSFMVCNEMLFNAQWAIVPKYVDFLQAMKALNDEKDVRFTPRYDSSIKIYITRYTDLEDLDNLDFDDLIRGKWVVIDND